MHTFVTVLYVIVCLFLILVVLLQAGRGGGMGAAMGGGSQTVFGGAGAGNFLQRLTVVSATLFMLLSATLAYMSSSGEQALERAEQKLKMREEARNLQITDGKPANAAVPGADSNQEVTTSSSEENAELPEGDAKEVPAGEAPADSEEVSADEAGAAPVEADPGTEPAAVGSTE